MTTESYDKFPQDEKFLAYPSANFNEETLEALREARLISEGKIPSKSFAAVEDLLKDLLPDVDVKPLAEIIEKLSKEEILDEKFC